MRFPTMTTTSAISNLRRFLPEGRFITNVLTLMTGTALAQLITIVTTPVIARLYNPDDFGLLALFTSVTGIISIVACWRYDQAIALPEKDEEAINVFALSVLAAIGMSFFLFLTMLFGSRKSIAVVLGSAKLSFWLWFVSLGVLCNGFLHALNYWSTHKKKFSYLAFSHISRSKATIGTIIIAAVVLGASAGGLIGGYVVGSIVAVVILGLQTWRNGLPKLLSSVRMNGIFSNAVKCRRFPYYDSWAGLVSSSSQRSRIFLLGHFFTPAVVGSYSMASKLLYFPVVIMAQSVRQVYLQKVSDFYASAKSMRELYARSTLILLSIGIIPFSAVWSNLL